MYFGDLPQMTLILSHGDSHVHNLSLKTKALSGWVWNRREGSRAQALEEWHSHCCSVAKSCPTLCDPMNCSTAGFSILHYLLEFAQTHALWVSHVIQPSHPLSPPSSLALYLSQHRGLYYCWWLTDLPLETSCLYDTNLRITGKPRN